jgi:hypothetical protein
VPWWGWLLVGLFAGATAGYLTAVLTLSAHIADSM